MEQKFIRQISSLDGIVIFINECFVLQQTAKSLTFLAEFVIEELFTNMVKYNHTTSKEIGITMENRNNTLIISLSDYDVDHFDPRDAQYKIDTSKIVEERIVGGLGVYLVKNMVDKIVYEHRDCSSKITVLKQMEKQYV